MVIAKFWGCKIIKFPGTRHIVLEKNLFADVVQHSIIIKGKYIHCQTVNLCHWFENRLKNLGSASDLYHYSTLILISWLVEMNFFRYESGVAQGHFELPELISLWQGDAKNSLKSVRNWNVLRAGNYATIAIRLHLVTLLVTKLVLSVLSDDWSVSVCVAFRCCHVVLLLYLMRFPRFKFVTPILFFVHGFMSFEQRYTTVAFI